MSTQSNIQITHMQHPDFRKGIKLKDLINYLNKQLFVAFMAMQKKFFCIGECSYFILYCDWNRSKFKF
jgi:hypothetical protein